MGFLDTAADTSDLATEATSFLNGLNLEIKNLWTQNTPETWLKFLVSVIGGVVLGWLLSAVLIFLSRRNKSRNHPGRAQVLRDLACPANLGLVTLGLSIGFGFLAIKKYLKDVYVHGLINLLVSIVIFWLIYNLIGIFGLAVKKLGHKNKSALDRQVVPLVERSLRVCLLILAILVICKSVFGQDIGTWLAGLGIAGLAVSLAAQDTLKNLFGSLTLLFDRPFQIGDHVVLCGTDGTIEDIGFRSTKIRTSPGHLVAIPNSNVVNASIENISRRCAIRRVINLMIPHDTPIEKLRDVLNALSKIFEEEEIRNHVHPSLGHGVEKAPQVRFEDILADEFKLTITYWYAPASDPNYSTHTEQVNLRIVEVLQKRGIVAPRLPLPEDPVT